MLKKIIVALLLLIVVLSSAVPASASESFSRADVPGGKTETRLSREMYTAVKSINASSLGIDEPLMGISDICSDNEGNILLLCGNESRLVKISADLKSAEEIEVLDSEGNSVDFKGAKGIYCDKNGDLYISDTLNARIVKTDASGKVLSVMETPKSELIPENFIYQPAALEIDAQGYTYILSLGCYYGALLYSPQNEFLGFYGANTTQASALDTLSYLWDKLTSTEAKKAASIRMLPYSFVDFDFDSEGYMVTCTGNTDNQHFQSLKTNGNGQIKKISHNGANILYKRSLKGDSADSSGVNFLEDRLSFEQTQDIVSIAVTEDDYMLALDRTYGLIYVYDSECNLMSAFGGGYGNSEQLGSFKEPVSMTIFADKLFVADYETASITVFETTEYGKLLCKAQNLYIKGDYSEAEGYWHKVLSLNRNCQLAYRGLAMSYYNNGNYDKALEMARLAMDYSVYEMAWQQKITAFIAKNFVWMLALIMAVLGGAIFVFVRLKKKNTVIIKNPKLRLALSVPFHPFDSFRTLKDKKQASVPIAIVITVLFYISSVLKVIGSGFLYNTTLTKNYNSLYSLGSTVGLLLLWSVSNWLVCSMFEGKGTLKEVYTATAYCLIPFVSYAFIKVIFSNFLPLSCEGLLNGIEIAILIYTIFMVAVAIIEIHEYDFFKVLLTTVVVIFFMILVVFIILMCVILLKQFYTFIGSIYEEITFR